MTCKKNGRHSDSRGMVRLYIGERSSVFSVSILVTNLLNFRDERCNFDSEMRFLETKVNQLKGLE